MTLIASLAEELRRHGFQIEKDDIFVKQLKSKELHAELKFIWQAKAEGKLSGSLAIRELDGEDWAKGQVRRYGVKQFATFDSSNLVPTVSFSIGEIAGWAPGWSLWRIFDVKEATQLTINAIDLHVLQMCEAFGDLEGLLRLLTDTSSPYYVMVRSNEAIRAALAIHVARRVGLPFNAFKRLFSDEARGLIWMAMGKPLMTGEEFLDRVSINAFNT